MAGQLVIKKSLLQTNLGVLLLDCDSTWNQQHPEPLVQPLQNESGCFQTLSQVASCPHHFTATSREAKVKEQEHRVSQCWHQVVILKVKSIPSPPNKEGQTQ